MDFASVRVYLCRRAQRHGEMHVPSSCGSLPCPHPLLGATVSYPEPLVPSFPRFHWISLSAIRSILRGKIVCTLLSVLLPLSGSWGSQLRAVVVSSWLWGDGFGCWFHWQFHASHTDQAERCMKLLRCSPEGASQPNFSSLPMHPMVIDWSRDEGSESDKALV